MVRRIKNNPNELIRQLKVDGGIILESPSQPTIENSQNVFPGIKSLTVNIVWDMSIDQIESYLLILSKVMFLAIKNDQVSIFRKIKFFAQKQLNISERGSSTQCFYYSKI